MVTFFYNLNCNFEWKVIKTSIKPLTWVWEDFTKYKEISVSISVADNEYQTICIPVIFLTDILRKFDISDTVNIYAQNNSLYFESADEGSVMVLTAR